MSKMPPLQYVNTLNSNIQQIWPLMPLKTETHSFIRYWGNRYSMMVVWESWHTLWEWYLLLIQKCDTLLYRQWRNWIEHIQRDIHADSMSMDQLRHYTVTTEQVQRWAYRTRTKRNRRHHKCGQHWQIPHIHHIERNHYLGFQSCHHSATASFRRLNSGQTIIILSF